MRFRAGIAALAVLVAACASGEPPAPDVPPRPPAAVSVIPNEGLPPQQLGPGECGLFLWAKTDPSKLVFFERGVAGVALLRINEKTLQLSKARTNGSVFGQFNTDTVYAAGPSSVRLQYEPGDELIGGQRIKNGLITQTPPGDWQIKLPVLGVMACQEE